MVYSDEEVEKLMSYVGKRIRLPIVCNDGRAFGYEGLLMFKKYDSRDELYLEGDHFHITIKEWINGLKED